MRKGMVRIVALLILVGALVTSFGLSYQQAQAKDSLCVPPYCVDFCLCRLEYQQGILRGGECILNICDVCYGEGVPCL
jgi:hypothetical protein